jgi:hypothetical protein
MGTPMKFYFSGSAIASKGAWLEIYTNRDCHGQPEKMAKNNIP